jgi:hypothetical protein
MIGTGSSSGSSGHSRARTRTRTRSRTRRSTGRSSSRTRQCRIKLLTLERHTIRRRRDASCVWNRCDGTKGFIRLCVRHYCPVTSRVGAWEILIIPQAGDELVILSVVGCVICTSDSIVDVLAEMRGVGAGWITDFYAEETGAYEAGL